MPAECLTILVVSFSLPGIICSKEKLKLITFLLGACANLSTLDLLTYLQFLLASIDGRAAHKAEEVFSF